MSALLTPPVFAAAGFSLIALTFSGGLGGAVLIFVISIMLGKNVPDLLDGGKSPCM